MTNWHTQPDPIGPCRWSFKRPTLWPDDDLVAAGGDLEPETIIAAYRQGLFPMEVGSPDPVLAWWSPDPRGVLPLDRLRVTRSMRRSARRYDIRVDTAFVDVIRGCANPSRDHGWISGPFIDAYARLHELGWAHSVEAFDDRGELAGGLYGLKIAGLFAGESMFSVQRDASKVALMALVALMRESGMSLLDVQWRTDHLASLGADAISRTQYLKQLAAALNASDD